MPLFHLISWCENFVERHSFHTRKLGEKTVFNAVQPVKAEEVSYCFEVL